MFNRAMFENSVADGMPVLEVVGGVEPPLQAVQMVVPLRRTELRGEVMGPLAGLRLTQYFGYSSEVCDRVLEARYRFPLPGDAAVREVRVRFGEVDIFAELKEREKAEADYKEAKRQGRQAALATRESPDVFTLNVAGIQPDQEIVVEISYVQLAKPMGSDWTLRIPLTTAPRFVRSDELDSRHADGQPLAVLRDPGHRFALDLTIHQADEVQSSTHELDVSHHGTRVEVRLRNGEVLPDRDCVLRWKAAQAEKRPTLHLMQHDDPQSEQLYFLALVAPPATHDYGTGVPREVVLLVDHSGSMSGAKWEAADWMVESFLSDLHERDAFALGLFHTRTRWFQRQLVRAEASTVEQAIDYLKKTRDSGGTNLGVALEQALELPLPPPNVGGGKGGGPPARHVLVVTDAQVSDAGRILRLADGEAAQKERRRISVICIDAAPNSFLATELAARGGGVSRFLTSNPKEGDITTALVEVLADWAEPVLAGLHLEINRSPVETLGHESSSQGKSSRIDLGDLPAGRAIWVAGRVPRGAGTLDFRLTAYDGHEVAALQVDSSQAESHPALKALFGARRILGLEYLINSGYQGKQLEEQLRRLGYDPQEALTGSKRSKIYAENVRQDAQKALRELLVRESLDYGLASAETAFVAVRHEAGKAVEGTVAVANALPSGWDGSFVRGAAPVMQAMAAPVMRGAPAPARARSMTRSGFRRSAPPATMPSPPSPPPASYSRSRSLGLADDESADQVVARSTPPQAPKRLQKRSVFGRLLDSFRGESSSKEAAKSSPAPKMDFMRTSPAAMEAPAAQSAPRSPSALLFSGLPKAGASQQTILFDSSSAQSNLPDHVTLRGLHVDFPNGAPKHRQLDRELSLLLFVGDLSQPRAQIRLTDIIRMRGKRPLNLVKQAGDTVRLVLFDPNGAWKEGAPQIEVTLRW